VTPKHTTPVERMFEATFEGELVGEGGFEPPTACPQSRCATELRHSPFDMASDQVFR